MMVNDWKAMQKKLENEARKFLMDAYGIELKIPVEINSRLKSTFGRFSYMKSRKQSIKIEMSKTYIENQDWQIIKETLFHECIHHACYELGKPHRDGDSYFEAELRKHGSHSTGTIRYRGKVVQYGCPKCKQVFTKKKRYPRNGLGYRCGSCKEQIEFLGEKVV